MRLNLKAAILLQVKSIIQISNSYEIATSSVQLMLVTCSLAFILLDLSLDIIGR